MSAPATSERGVRPLCACGTTIALAMLAMALLDPRERPCLFVASAVLAGSAYVLAFVWLPRIRAESRRALAMCLALAALWRVPFLVLPPRLSSDVYRYVWDGRLQRLGYNPYIVVPEDPGVAHLHTATTRRMENGWVPTIYPPAAELFFRGVTAVEESPRAMKAALLACDVSVAVMLLGWLAATGRSPWWVLAYAWNPLVAIEGGGNAHVDLLGTMCLTLVAWSLARRWTMLAAASFALAVAVKLLPAVLAPLLWRRVRLRDALVGTALLVGLYLPFVDGGRLPLGSVGQYLVYWRFNGPAFATLVQLVPPRRLAAVAVLIGFALAAWTRAKLPRDSADAWSWPIAATLVLAPSVYPWYLLWLTPFLSGSAGFPLAVWTVSILPTYVAFHVREATGEWIVPCWLVAVEYGSVAAAAVWVAARRWRTAR